MSIFQAGFLNSHKDDADDAIDNITNKLFCNLGVCRCGVVNNRIVGGFVAAPHSLPYQVHTSVLTISNQLY